MTKIEWFINKLTLTGWYSWSWAIFRTVTLLLYTGWRWCRISSRNRRSGSWRRVRGCIWWCAWSWHSLWRTRMRGMRYWTWISSCARWSILCWWLTLLTRRVGATRGLYGRRYVTRRLNDNNISVIPCFYLHIHVIIWTKALITDFLTNYYTGKRFCKFWFESATEAKYTRFRCNVHWYCTVSECFPAFW